MALPAATYQEGGAPLTGAGRRSRVPARAIQGPTSAVVTEVRDWADASLLVFHEPIRLDLLELDHVLSVEYFDGLSAWKTATIFKWFKKIFQPLVLHYLRVFREALLPAITAKDPSVNAENLCSMHLSIVNKLAQINGFQRQFRTASRHVNLQQSVREQRQTACELRGCVKELLTCVTEDLARAEMLLLPVIRERLSEAEWRELARSVLLGPLGRKLRSKQLPWLLAAAKVWAPREHVTSFRALLPWSTRFRLDYFWYCSYVNGPAKRLRLIKNDYIPS